MAGKWWDYGKSGAVALMCLCAPISALAQTSGYGCTGLDTSDAIPSVEGNRGTFYPIDPDLMMAHDLSEENLADLAHLSRVLKANGTTLIYLPMPTKALGQPWDLPRMASYLGYEPDIAATLYDEGLKRLGQLDVIAVNARQTLAEASRETPAFFSPDPRLTAQGSRALAQAVAQALGATGGGAFATAEAQLTSLPSPTRFDLSEHCQTELPRLETPVIVTATGDAPASLFQAQDAAPQIALVGTHMTGEPATHFAGLLQEASGFGVAQYHVPNGGAFAAISAYVTSAGFAQWRPRFLIWEHPIWDNLSARGEQPMQELIAAAGPACSLALPLDYDRSANLLRADLSGLDLAKDYVLALDTDGAQAGSARFAFQSETGLERIRSIYRHRDQAPTGRFNMPMTGLWQAGAASVAIALDAPIGRAPRLFACPVSEGT